MQRQHPDRLTTLRTARRGRIITALSLSVSLHVLLLWPQSSQPPTLKFALQPASLSVSFESTKLAAAPPRQQHKSEQTTPTRENAPPRQAKATTNRPVINTTLPARLQVARRETPRAQKVKLIRPAPSPQPASEAEAAAEAISDPALNRARIIARINQDYRQYFYYPKLARRRNIQGTVVLALGIGPQGTVNTVQVAKSSGYSMLDDAATDAMQQLRNGRQQKYHHAANATNINFHVKYQLMEH